MIKHNEVFAPEMVERLQQDRFLDIAYDVGTPLRHLRRHMLVGAAFDAREDFFVGNAFFLRPFVDRKIETEHALELLTQPGGVPLFRIGILGHVFGYQIVDHGMPHVGDHLATGLIFHPFDALVENDLALIVHHVVEFQE